VGGESGKGKTTATRTLFGHLEVVCVFDCRCWKLLAPRMRRFEVGVCSPFLKYETDIFFKFEELFFSNNLIKLFEEFTNNGY
jgi:hypothetical protein